MANELTPALAMLVAEQIKLGTIEAPVWVDEAQHREYLKHGLNAKDKSK